MSLRGRFAACFSTAAAAALLTAVIAGDPSDAATKALLATALAHPDPATVVLHAPDPAALPAGHPAHGKGAAGGRPAAYVCRAGTCSLPVADPGSLRDALGRGSLAPAA